MNNDITQFTHYLKATPWDDPEIYAKTSPMTYIKTAKAPTLIQHGSADQRVPPPNAFELHRGLQDVGVPSKLIIYKGFRGRGPRSLETEVEPRADADNLQWFDQYIWGVSPKTTTSGVASRPPGPEIGAPRVRIERCG